MEVGEYFLLLLFSPLSISHAFSSLSDELQAKELNLFLTRNVGFIPGGELLWKQ